MPAEKKKQYKEALFSKKGFLVAVCLIILSSSALASFVYIEAKKEYSSALKNYRHDAHFQATQAKQNIELAFQHIHENIRTIGKLPSIRTIDRHAETLNENDRITIQEIYNNLAENVSVSEVYVLPKDFNPDAIDPVTGKLESPIIMFDHMIIGRTRDDYFRTSPSEEIPNNKTEEIETYEYHLLREQITWMKNHYPSMDALSGQVFPALGSREIITCDNSRYSPAAPDNADRSGLIYSVPYYDFESQFKGIISAIILTQAIRDMLPDTHYALINSAHRQKILAKNPSGTLLNSGSWIEKETANPDLIYSEVLPLSLHDSAGDWKLWVGFPNDVFFSDNRNTEVLELRNLACLAIALFAAFGIFGLYLLRQSHITLQKELLKAKNEAEAETERKTRFLSNIIDNAVDGLITIDDHGMVQSFNPASEIIFQYKTSEVLGKNINLLMPEPYSSAHDDYLRRAREAKSIKIVNIRREVIGKRKNGETFPLDLAVSQIMLDNGVRLFSGIVRDISDRKKAEMQMQEYATQLEMKSLELATSRDVAEQSTRLKSEFLANMSHEIRTPMNGVIGMTNLLLETDLSNTQKTYARAALNSAENLLQLVNDILDFSKIEAGKLDLEFISFDLQTLIEEVADLIAIKAQEKNLELLLRFEPNMPRFVIGDPGRVRQIFLNLASNALKFTEAGHVLINISVLEEQNNGSILFRGSVEDTGIGIPEDKQDYIFNKFSQADGSTSRKYGGTGLGLAICKELANMMEGSIGVESTPGVGSTFWVTFRLEKDTAAAERPIPNFSIDMSNVRVLIVDDNKIAQDIAAEHLRKNGIKHAVSSSGEEAIAVMSRAAEEKEPYDMAILDYMMPEMDGLELAEQIKKNPALKETSLLMISSAPSRGDSERTKNAGFSGFLSKPVSGVDIIRALYAIKSMRDGISPHEIITRHTLREFDARSDQNEIENLFFNGAQILLAEDNPTNQLVATTMLEKMGCHVTPAGNGREVIRLVKQRHFDLIFMDCEMPEMDGFEATRTLRNIEKRDTYKKTPIIAFTAHAMKGDEQKCYAAGMDDYITKPVKKKSLANVLKKWLTPDGENKENLETDNTDQKKEILPILTNETGIDFDTLREMKDFMAEKFVETVEKYIRNGTLYIEQAHEAFAARDKKAIASAAHPLKSSSALLGLMHVSETSAALETLAEENTGFDETTLKALQTLLVDLAESFEKDRKILLNELKSSR